MNRTDHTTPHEERASFVKFMGVLLIIYCIYRYIRCVLVSRSFIAAFQSAVFDDEAPLMITVFLISIVIPFIDWALYSIIKQVTVSFGTTYAGIIKEEIRQSRLSRGGGYLTYRYIVLLDDGTTVKSPVYTSQVYHKKCVVHKFFNVIVRTDFEF